MPRAGDYLFSNVGFSPTEQPFILLQQTENFVDLTPIGKTLTLRFNTKQRFCIGWGDISTGERFACPDHHIIDSKYEQCPACQQRTGFNPAFYHATSVSKQQEARNLQPHMLYLAHFGQDIIKVGISYAQRGNSRLLEQGARTALVLDTFPTALIARQYEARIAALPGMAETIQLRKKIVSLMQPYDKKAAAEELIKTRTKIEQNLGATFSKNIPLFLDPFYFSSNTLNLAAAHDCSEQNMISGKIIGMLGSLLFCEHQDTPVFLPLKKYIGYRITLSYEETDLSLPAKQMLLL